MTNTDYKKLEKARRLVNEVYENIRDTDQSLTLLFIGSDLTQYLSKLRLDNRIEYGK